MTLQERIDLLVKLGAYIQEDTEERQLAIAYTKRFNGWLTKHNSLKALTNIATAFLKREVLEAWANRYKDLQNLQGMKRIGLVLAGNIPAVGFHDVLVTFLVGHKALIKYSSKDEYLIPYMLDFMIKEHPSSAAYFEKALRLKDFDAVIATGSNNSALYFEQYFSKYPNVIRKNRNSIAVLNGKETDDELLQLGIDIFRYFGLGCRSVSKIYVPKDYDFPRLMQALDNYKDIMNHNKYRNNFDYNRSIYLLNDVSHFVNDCLMVVKHESLLSRISSIHYEIYEDEADLMTKLEAVKDDTQCVVSKMNLSGFSVVDLGQAQNPAVDDYADGVDTVQFLMNLN